VKTLVHTFSRRLRQCPIFFLGSTFLQGAPPPLGPSLRLFMPLSLPVAPCCAAGTLQASCSLTRPGRVFRRSEYPPFKCFCEVGSLRPSLSSPPRHHCPPNRLKVPYYFVSKPFNAERVLPRARVVLPPFSVFDLSSACAMLVEHANVFARVGKRG